MHSAPNLIYVFADQLRHDVLGYAGDAKARTPHLDRFAGQSLNLVNMLANTPVCTAYRATLMTGKYTTSHGMVINEIRMNPNQRALGHMLTEAGYDTSYIGKWHLYANELGNHSDPKNSFVPSGPDRLGFDGEWKAYNFHHLNFGEESYYHEDTPEKIYYPGNAYEPEAQTDLAIDFIQRASRRKTPFAMVLSWGAPHDPWGPDNVPAEYWDMFKETEFPNPPNYRAENDEPYADSWAKLSVSDRAQLPDWRRGYYAQVSSIDAQFGRLMTGLEAAGIADNTIVVFTSDHGEMFGAHGRRAKLIFYDEAARVPFLMRWPGHIPAGASSDICFSAVDILPTLAGLMGLDAAPDVEGMDLSHLMLGREGPAPLFAFLQGCGAVAAWQDGHEWRAVRDKRFTYARYRVDGREFLFDNLSDPFQVDNLAGRPEWARTRMRLAGLMEARMAEIHDSFEASTYYERQWTDRNRNIVRGARGYFGPGGKSGGAAKH